MRKRRVGVTARSRRIAGHQATGSGQIDTEMAALLELRTPMCTAAQAAIRVRMEAWRQWRGGQSAESNPAQKWQPAGLHDVAETARWARMRRCLTLRQGQAPETPAPFPSDSSFQKEGNLSRVRKPRKTGAPLTDSLPSEEIPAIRKRGPLAQRGHRTASRRSAPRSYIIAQA